VTGRLLGVVEAIEMTPAKRQKKQAMARDKDTALFPDQLLLLATTTAMAPV